MSKPAARLGLILMLLGAAVDSTSGLFTRLIAADGFTLTAGRGLFAFLALFSVLLWRERGRWLQSLKSVGLMGLLLVLFNSSGMAVNVISLSYTGVANFFMIFATAPFAAAIAAWLVLGERLDVATLLAAVAGFLGIAVMMFSGTKGGALIGDLLAVACVLIFSVIVLLVRSLHHIDVLPISCLNVLGSALLTLPFADFSGLAPRDWGWLTLFGIFQLALGTSLIYLAMRRIPAAQSGLLGILNAAFAPLWVLVFLGEAPERNVLIGGGIILASSLAHLLWTMTRRVEKAA